MVWQIVKNFGVIKNIPNYFSRIAVEQAINWEVKMALFEKAINAIIATDQEGRVIAWNETATIFFGWTEKEMIGKDIADYIIPEKHRDAHRTGMMRYRQYSGDSKAVGNPAGIELDALRKDGTTICIRLYLSKIESKEGYVKFGAFIVNTEAEKAIVKAYEKKIGLMACLEEIGRSGAWRYNILTEEVEYSHGLYRLLGINEHMPYVKGLFIERVFHEDKPIVEAAMVESIEHGKGFDIELRIPRLNGTMFRVSAKASARLDENLKLVELTGVVQYIDDIPPIKKIK